MKANALMLGSMGKCFLSVSYFPCCVLIDFIFVYKGLLFSHHRVFPLFNMELTDSELQILYLIKLAEGNERKYHNTCYFGCVCLCLCVYTCAGVLLYVHM